MVGRLRTFDERWRPGNEVCERSYDLHEVAEEYALFGALFEPEVSARASHGSPLSVTVFHYLQRN